MKKIHGYINNYEEAVMVVHAARIGTLDLTIARLNAEERERIESGDIFIFIENDHGMKRWTDGRIWSPSKICGEFLIYQEVPRHLSKNSIKKRKEIEKVMEGVDIVSRQRMRDDTVDRATMHKKTVCIRYENDNYHIIAYYRPIFASHSLIDVPYFKKLTLALNTYPQLRENESLRNERATNPEFHETFGLLENVEPLALDPSKRELLEKITLEVLVNLSRTFSSKEKMLMQ
ncbi:Gti1/Pac2 family transcription factor [Enteropsectra breve]|nr:Gti1/Pac2 family transcription factor [Enteropsectra breve]